MVNSKIQAVVTVLSLSKGGHILIHITFNSTYVCKTTVKSLLRAAALIPFDDFGWGSYSRAAVNWGRLLLEKYQKLREIRAKKVHFQAK